MRDGQAGLGGGGWPQFRGFERGSRGGLLAGCLGEYLVVIQAFPIREPNAKGPGTQYS